MMNRFHQQQQRTNARDARGFTVVEMLIVVAIIILLLSILLVALNAASRASQSASTSVRMQAMSRGLVQFRTDMGYLPPILNNDRDLLLLPGHDPNSGTYGNLIQSYNSVTSMAEYLAGYGDRDQDGYGVAIGGPNTDPERPPFGIRHPGPDGVWGASLVGGELDDRTPSTQGDVFGPYLVMDDAQMLASISVSSSTGQLNVFFPGEAGYDETAPKAIVDYWGRPIRYFRKPYPLGGLRTGFMQVDRDGNGTIDRVPSLGDVWLLRPFSIRPGEDIDSPYGDSGGDTATTSSLNSAAFALFSPGPDKTFNQKYRYDDPAIGGVETSFANRDNIVELGE
jgi:type II secretory pathway pseudopilin PulG